MCPEIQDTRHAEPEPMEPHKTNPARIQPGPIGQSMNLCVCIYICLFICICMYIYIYVYLYACMSVYIYIYVYVRTCVLLSMYMPSLGLASSSPATLHHMSTYVCQALPDYQSLRRSCLARTSGCSFSARQASKTGASGS